MATQELTTVKLNDLLERKNSAKKFYNILLGQNANLFSINGSWGAGKTFFIKLIEEINQEKKETLWITYNIWESDFVSEPLIPLVDELTQSLESYKEHITDKDELTQIQTEIQDIKKIGYNISEIFKKKMTYNVGGSVGIPKVAGVQANIQFDPTKGDSEYKILKKQKEKFIESLKSISRIINKPIIICIDELDRCRPLYAIKALETIKHFFQENNENLGIKFVIAVDKIQMQNTIKTIYGMDADTDCYLRKFIDIEYSLSNPQYHSFIIDFMEKNKYCGKTLFERLHEHNQVFGLNWQAELYNIPYTNYSVLIESYCKIFEFKPRDIEKYLLKLNIVLDSFKVEEPPILLNYLLALLGIQVKNTKMYDFCIHSSNHKLTQFINHINNYNVYQEQRHFFNNLSALEGFSITNQTIIDWIRKIRFNLNHETSVEHFGIEKKQYEEVFTQRTIDILGVTTSHFNPDNVLAFFKSLKEYPSKIDFVSNLS